jgi:hypothetical protein
MHYLLTIYIDESGFAESTPEQAQEMTTAYLAVTEEMKAAGAFIGGDGLQPTSTATTVTVRDGETIVTDGPFAETREQLGGYYLLDCKDLDEAIGWAARIPGSHSGSVEVRPVIVYEGAAAAQRQTEGVA